MRFFRSAPKIGASVIYIEIGEPCRMYYMTDTRDTPDEEPIGDFTIRIWKECREEMGFAAMFLNYCINNHFHIVREFTEFDEMMGGD
jgi:hypothetical protein